MRKSLATGLVAASLMFATTAYAEPEIGIKIIIDNTVVDTMPLTAGGGSFNLSYSANPFISSVSVTSTGAPTTPDPNFGTISINATSAFTGGTHTLELIATQINLTGGGFGELASSFTYNGLFNPGNVTSVIGTTYVDQGDAAYATTTVIASTPNEHGASTYSSPVIDYSATPNPLFSETEDWKFTFTGSSLTETSSQISGVPEPISIALLGTGLIGIGAARRRRS